MIKFFFTNEMCIRDRLLTLAFAATMLAGCGSKTDTTDTTETTEATSADDETSDGAADTADTSENEELLTGLHHVKMCIRDRYLHIRSYS